MQHSSLEIYISKYKFFMLRKFLSKLRPVGHQTFHENAEGKRITYMHHSAAQFSITYSRQEIIKYELWKFTDDPSASAWQQVSLKRSQIQYSSVMLAK
jgi:hypothetical protein